MEGKAYGFFKCNRTKEKVNRIAKRLWCRGIESKLEISTIDETIRNEPDLSLLSIDYDAKEQGINYVLKGTRTDAPNSEVAHDLTTSLNQMYQSPLYKPERKEPFCGAVYYEEHGEYLEKE